MASLRFTQVPQPVIPNQRNDEVIYVLSRKHYLDYLPFATILAALAIIPLGAILIGLGPFLNLLETSSIIVRDIIILAFVAYYLFLAGVFIARWTLASGANLSIVTNSHS